jgi:glycosyl-4,4'-diaponeurosporenoate acyltransferase
VTLPVVALSPGWAVLVDAAVWAVGGTTAGYLTHRLGQRAFQHDGWLTRPRRFEEPPSRFYERRLRIKRWKARLPEAGDLFRDGFDKKHLAGDDPAYFERFVVETRRAEVTHWVVLALAPFFVLWNPWWLALVMGAYALAANLPCIAIQRYNRLRLRRVLERSARLRADH